MYVTLGSMMEAVKASVYPCPSLGEYMKGKEVLVLCTDSAQYAIQDVRLSSVVTAAGAHTPVGSSPMLSSQLPPLDKMGINCCTTCRALLYVAVGSYAHCSPSVLGTSKG